MKKINVIIGIVVVVIVIFIITIKANSNNKEEVKNIINNNSGNTVITTDQTKDKVENEVKEVPVKGMTFSNVSAQADEENDKNILIFKAKNDTNKTIENKEVICIFKDVEEKVIGRKTIHIQQLSANEEIDEELEIENELTGAKSFEFVENNN